LVEQETLNLKVDGSSPSRPTHRPPSAEVQACRTELPRRRRAWPTRPAGADPGLTAIDLDAARELADFHRLLASGLPPDSRLRGLMLRRSTHWSRLGAIPRNGLAEAERD
jgi:hypothetical protein